MSVNQNLRPAEKLRGTKNMQTDSLITTSEFIRRHMLAMSVRPTDRNPAMPDSDYMDNWLVTLRAPGGKKMCFVFSMGRGHHGAKPTQEAVLSCLAMDASGIDNAGDFAGWCAEYGCDTDSRKAFRTFRACQRSAKKLLALLGDEAYGLLLWGTEQE